MLVWPGRVGSAAFYPPAARLLLYAQLLTMIVFRVWGKRPIPLCSGKLKRGIATSEVAQAAAAAANIWIKGVEIRERLVETRKSVLVQLDPHFNLSKRLRT
ncbi:hypothetical protein B0H66DRAFT_526373 [Apodospora peruviana]|uniref:Uncharacterized protein n=1 Tax=Apodospora peruviana TaxID=516989 RepID=A0AAE0IQ35_9PEZI|nr:hypothetical protein B0H66DRAFT_526373 [Apodospora peruviana]